MYSKFLNECMEGKVSEFPSDRKELSEGFRLASGHGHLEVLKKLYEKGADPTTDNNDPICWASAQGHFEIVQYLIELNVSPTVRENYPLRKTIFNGIPHKKKPNHPFPKLESWAITDSSFGARSARTALFLLDHIKPDLSSFILDCLYHGEVEVIQYIYTHMNPGPVSQGDSLFLRFASRHGDRMVQFLLRLDIHVRSKDGMAGGSEKLNIQACDNEALMNACEVGHKETVNLLLEKNADASARNFQAFRLASLSGNIELLKLLTTNLFSSWSKNIRPTQEEKKEDLVDRQKDRLRVSVKKLLQKEHRGMFENLLCGL